MGKRNFHYNLLHPTVNITILNKRYDNIEKLQKKDLSNVTLCNKIHKDLKSIVDIGIPVMGHIGFTPQHFSKFKVQGILVKDHYKLLDQAEKNQKAGVFSIVLECVNTPTAKAITKLLKIPTIGIGASSHCDGQILVTDDMLGLSGFYPRFVKKFANLNNIIEIGIKKYKKAVLNKKFPSKKNTF